MKKLSLKEKTEAYMKLEELRREGSTDFVILAEGSDEIIFYDGRLLVRGKGKVKKRSKKELEDIYE